MKKCANKLLGRLCSDLILKKVTILDQSQGKNEDNI